MTALEVAPDEAVPFTQEQQMLRDWLTTAVEGGIGYWSVCMAYVWNTWVADEVHASVVEQDASTGATPIRVGLVELRQAMNRIVNDPTGCAIGRDNPLRKLLFNILFDIEAGDNWLDLDSASDFDAVHADMVFQVAALGQVIYG